MCLGVDMEFKLDCLTGLLWLAMAASCTPMSRSARNCLIRKPAVPLRKYTASLSHVTCACFRSMESLQAHIHCRLNQVGRVSISGLPLEQLREVASADYGLCWQRQSEPSPQLQSCLDQCSDSPDAVAWLPENSSSHGDCFAVIEVLSCGLRSRLFTVHALVHKSVHICNQNRGRSQVNVLCTCFESVILRF